MPRYKKFPVAMVIERGAFNLRWEVASSRPSFSTPKIKFFTRLLESVIGLEKAFTGSATQPLKAKSAFHWRIEGSKNDIFCN